jgi:hypothetical protein
MDTDELHERIDHMHPTAESSDATVTALSLRTLAGAGTVPAAPPAGPVSSGRLWPRGWVGAVEPAVEPDRQVADGGGECGDSQVGWRQGNGAEQLPQRR